MQHTVLHHVFHDCSFLHPIRPLLAAEEADLLPPSLNDADWSPPVSIDESEEVCPVELAGHF